MKPKTKAEVRLVKINESIRKLTNKEIQWAYNKVLFHKCRLLKSGKANCLDCGHQWHIKGPASSLINILLKIDCPNCKISLDIEQTRTINFNDSKDVIHIQTHKGYQVVRFFVVYGHYRAGEPAKLYHIEKSRFYIGKDNVEQIVTCTRCDNWSGTHWGHTMELRYRGALNKYLSHSKYIYPIKGILKRIKRNGYNGLFHKWHPHYFFHQILIKPIAETLLKAKRIDLFNYYLEDKRKEANVEKYWSAIKLCLKHNYPIGAVGVQTYFDYMGDLERHNKDFNNIKFACPNDFIRQHSKYIEKDRKARLKADIKALKKKLIAHNKIFVKEKSMFFKLKFKNRNLEIVPFKSVEQLMNESDLLIHCAYNNEYHLDKNSLLFSARIDGKVTETVEVDISKLEVTQARGYDNEPSIYNRRIVKLMKKSIPAIEEILQKRMKPKIKLKKAV